MTLFQLFLHATLIYSAFFVTSAIASYALRKATKILTGIGILPLRANNVPQLCGTAATVQIYYQLFRTAKITLIQ